MRRNKALLAALVWLGCLPAGTGPILLAGDVVINEIHYDPADKTRLEEFIELHNKGAAPVDLSSWYFSSGISFVFPAGTVIPAEGYIVVAESPAAWEGRLPAAALGPYEGFLDADGENIVLRNATGAIEDEVDYGVGFPWPVASAGDGPSMELIHPDLDNDLGGSWRASLSSPALPVSPVTLIASEDPAWHYRKGTSEASDPPHLWREVEFVEDASWLLGQTSIGYVDDDDNTVLDDMLNNYSTVYLRHTFVLDAASGIPPALLLRMYVDDGSICWINGVEVARLHVVSGDQPFNGRASSHEASWEEKLLLDTGAFLREGINVLAIHALNQAATSSDFSIDAELQIPSRDTMPAVPTPGARNSVHAENAPPQVRQVTHFPEQPLSGNPIVVQAKVTDPDGVSSVELRYQIVLPGSYVPARLALPVSQLLAAPLTPRPDNPAFEDPASWTTLALRDDGKGEDLVEADGIHTGVIPPQINRTLVRYRVTATDTLTASLTVPYPDDGALNFACFVYDGVPPYQTTRASVHPEGVGHIYDPDILTSIPVYFLLTKAQDMAECLAYNSTYQIPKSNENARDAFNWEGAFVYDGVVYDHVNYRLRQANDRYGGAGKRSMRIRFHKGSYAQFHDYRGREYPTRWRTLNVGKQVDNLRVGNFGLTEAMNSILWNMVGVPAPFMHQFHFRVVDGQDEAPAGLNGQYYGDFWGMFLATEDYDPRFIDAHGMADGNLYKLKDGIFNGNLLRRNQGRYSITTDADFQNIRQNLRVTQPAAWLDQHVRYDRWYPYHTVVEAIRHYDFVPADSHSKNRAWFFEPAEGTPYGLLWTLPHDSDASWGPNWNSGIDYSTAAIASGADKAPFRQAYRNFIREFRDLLWRQDVINPMIDELAGAVREFSFADRDRWRSAPADAGTQDFGPLDTKVTDMKNFAFVGWSGSTGPTVPAGGRAAYLDILSRAEGDSTGIPVTPVVTSAGAAGFPVDDLVFATTPFDDPQGAGTFASMAWRLAEVMKSGEPQVPGELPLYEWHAVWESGEIGTFQPTMTIPLTVAKIGHTYRVRARMTDTTGKTSHWSEPLEFTAGPPQGTILQLEALRITEIMYNPAGDSEYEFIEILNVGASPVDLSDVRFTDGIEFSFAEGSVATLDPGAYLVVVKNRIVFSSRYDTTGMLIAGEYSGKLENAGEALTLSYGEIPILSFAYSDVWIPATDGAGYSLVILDPLGPASSWGVRTSWKASKDKYGSPGGPDEDPVIGGLVVPGDINRDGQLDISDAVSTLGHLFLGTPAVLPCGDGSLGAESNRTLLDSDGDGNVNLTDPIQVLQYLFQGGPPPALGTECVRIAGCTDACATP